MRGDYLRGAPRRRRFRNWRFPLRLWFKSPAEAWEFIFWCSAAAALAGLGFSIILRH